MATDPVSPLVFSRVPLLTRAKSGDLEAHEQLFRQYQGAVYTVARRIVGNDQDAEEVLQETFLEVFRSLGSMRRESSFSSWVRRIASRKAIDRLRREKLRRAAPLEIVPEMFGESGGGSDGVGRPDRRIDLGRALSGLPTIARAVVWLFDVEGFTHAEIADMTGRSVSFSKSQLARARERLRRCLEGKEVRRG